MSCAISKMSLCRSGKARASLRSSSPTMPSLSDSPPRTYLSARSSFSKLRTHTCWSTRIRRHAWYASLLFRLLHASNCGTENRIAEFLLLLKELFSIIRLQCSQYLSTCPRADHFLPLIFLGGKIFFSGIFPPFYSGLREDVGP